MNLYDYVITIPNYPKEGIMFRDITPLMENKDAFKEVVVKLAEEAKKSGATIIAGPEARGFLFGAAVAAKLGLGFVPLRKPGKLPREQVRVDYDCEYAKSALCAHKDSFKNTDKVYLVDDLLATGGTINAAISLVELLDAKVCGVGFVIELKDLNGRNVIKCDNVKSLISFEGK